MSQAKKFTRWPKKIYKGGTKRQKIQSNLNTSSVELSDKSTYILKNTNLTTEKISVFFRDIKTHLIKEIEWADKVYGCVAWITDGDILNALSKKKECALVVNKEEFMYPTSSKCWDSLKEKLRSIPKFVVMNEYNEWKRDGYETFVSTYKPNMDEHTIYAPVCQGMDENVSVTTYSKRTLVPKDLTLNDLIISDTGDPEFHLLARSKLAGKTLDPIRNVGIIQQDEPGYTNGPRLHDKFFVMIKGHEWKLWTGSFNASVNSSNSLENAVLIFDKDVSIAYLTEWQQLYLVSESRNDDWYHNKPENPFKEDWHEKWTRLFEKFDWYWTYGEADHSHTTQDLSSTSRFTINISSDSVEKEFTLILDEEHVKESKKCNLSPSRKVNDVDCGTLYVGIEPVYKDKKYYLGYSKSGHLCSCLGFCENCDMILFSLPRTESDCVLCGKTMDFIHKYMDIKVFWNSIKLIQ